MITPRFLSKSKILSGWQCHKRLWLEVHDPHKAEIDAAAERGFEIGHQVGEIARRLFPDGVLIGHEKDLSGALAETERRLSEPGPVTLFEPALRHAGVLFRADVLIRDARDRIRLVEVKAATKVKPVYLIDCAVQTWVLAGLELHPARVELAHVNNQFVYPGGDDYRGLIALEDVTDKVAPMLEHVPAWLEEYRGMLDGEVPPIEIGPQCGDPYDCPFLTYCTPPQPDYPVRCLPGGKKAVWLLLEEGIEDIRDVPAGRLTSERQEWVRRVTCAGAPELKPGAARALAELAWPRYYLDFETVAFAVPIWPGTRPYQALPFQWSCHIETEDGALTHRAFLADGAEPPMREFAESLIDALGESGPILVYTHYEARILGELAAMYPDLAPALEAIASRLFDLHPVAKANYYHPDMLGSWSIKAVLPTIAPEMAYETLGEIQEGSAASEAFLEIIDPATTDERRQALREALIAYCAHDTLAMVRVAKKFVSAAN
jgi:hypothetical protein